MARPKGIKQKRNEEKYWLPSGVKLKEGQRDDYTKGTKLIFVDEVNGDFVSSFKSIQDANGSTHPISVQKRRENTNTERYGGINPHCSEGVRFKFKETMKAKYGVENALENKDLLNKSQETLMKNYGVKTPMESDELKRKVIIKRIT